MVEGYQLIAVNCKEQFAFLGNWRTHGQVLQNCQQSNYGYGVLCAGSLKFKVGPRRVGSSRDTKHLNTNFLISGCFDALEGWSKECSAMIDE